MKTTKTIAIVILICGVGLLWAAGRRPHMRMGSGPTPPAGGPIGTFWLDTDASEHGDVVIFTDAWRAVDAADSPPPVAFPGAEGFGAIANGWRDAKATIYHVTTLADDADSAPAGSLRAALETGANDPKYIVFDVGGVIEIDSSLDVGSNTYIAGQTAPGGITLYGGRLIVPGTFRASGGDDPPNPGDTTFTDICIRYVHFRATHLYEGTRATTRNMGIVNTTRFIVDHCSFSGGADEDPGNYSTSHCTYQWCTMEEQAYWGQNGSGHDEGMHNFGFLCGHVNYPTMTLHHNIFANNYRRMPKLDSDLLGGFHFINNVVFNWWQLATHTSTSATGNMDVVNNSWIVGKSTVLNGKRNANIGPIANAILLYMPAGNRKEATNGSTVWDAVTAGDDFGGDPQIQGEAWVSGVQTPVATETAADAYTSTLAKAGAWPRDATTRRTVTEIGQEEAGGGMGIRGPFEYFPEDTDGETAAANDVDRDGINDDWEDANGLDDTDGTDSLNVIASGEYTGYQEIEKYLDTRHDDIEEVDGTTFAVSITPDVEAEGSVVNDSGVFSQEEFTTSDGSVRGFNNTYWFGNVPFGEATYHDGSIAIAKAKPAPGHEFTAWTGAPVANDTGNEVQFAVTENRTVQATFADLAVRTITVTINPAGKGIVTGSVCVGSDDPGTYYNGEIVTLAATATDAGYQFKQWNLGGQAFDTFNNPTIEFPAVADLTIEAEFEVGDGSDFLIDDFEDGDAENGSTWDANLSWTQTGQNSFLRELTSLGGGSWGMTSTGALGHLRLGLASGSDSAAIPAGATTLNFELWNLDDTDPAAIDIDDMWEHGPRAPGGGFEGMEWTATTFDVLGVLHQRRHRGHLLALVKEGTTTWRIPLSLFRDNDQANRIKPGDLIKEMEFGFFMTAEVWGGVRIAIDSVSFGRAIDGAISQTQRDPVAEAGPAQLITDVDGDGSVRVWLDGSKSYDQDAGLIAATDYAWTWAGGSATGPCPKIDLTATKTITLTVTDEDARTAQDTVVITLR